ncbi:MAG TPA: DUF3147 family protein [Acidobacteriaceae bacterium]|jgi:hypothetical protein|nr:DUF3147 family protein [Acidobacteriaceae bacterium]
MHEILLRFLIGGLIVSLFAIVGTLFRPKSFAGLFGAAPSIALATLGLTIARNGKVYAAVEARSMILGALAFLLYAACASWVMMRWNRPALKATLVLAPVWFAASLGVWMLIGVAR